MPFEKGKSGNVAGKPPGIKSKNSRYTEENFRFIFQREDFDPILKMVELAKNGKTERIQLDAASEILSYVAPKLKAVEITSEDVQSFGMFMNFAGKEGKPDDAS